MMYNLFFLLSAYALMYMAVNAINIQRDGLNMTWLTSVVRKTLNKKSDFQLGILGMSAMILEGDTMRASGALFGFANGRVINQSETATALVASSVSKMIWIWIASCIAMVSIYYESLWIAMTIIGVFVILVNVSDRMNAFGNFMFYIGILLMGLMFASATVSNIASQDLSIWNYTAFSDVVGVVLSGFAGVIVGALLSGNLLSVLMILPFVTFGMVGVECAVAFVVGTEVGVLFPMSLMLSESTLQSKKSFLFFAIVVIITWLIDIILLSVFDLSFLTSIGVFGFAIAYSVLFSMMLIIVYFVSGMKLWSKLSGVADTSITKRHLHKFGVVYSPHVSVLLLQAEKEIVNLQFRIHKMLDFTIELIDNEKEEDIQEALNHVRKYKVIVTRTGKEITDYIVTQTSMKNNVHVSGFAMERLHAVGLQCQIGTVFCDMAEAICKSDRSNYPIIRRCVVALETLYNQATKLINCRFNSHDKDGKVLVEDVEELSEQLTVLLNEFGKDPISDVIPYTIVKSKEIITEIIESLK